MKRRIASLFLATTTLTILVAYQQPENDDTENRSNPSNTEEVKPNNRPSPSDNRDQDKNDNNKPDS